MFLRTCSDFAIPITSHLVTLRVRVRVKVKVKVRFEEKKVV